MAYKVNQYLTNSMLSSPLFLVGYSLIAINGQPVTNQCVPDGTTAMTLLANPENYPVSLKFARLRVSINERIMLLSMFHS